MRVVSVVGARPQFVKLAAVCAGLAESGLQDDIEHVVVHTGQHYDEAMSTVFFTDLAMAPPEVNLAVGSGSHGQQTGRMLEALEATLLDYQPDWTLVYGDTNSTLAAAVAAVKVHLPVAHLEAGLRSRNRRMPEEHNRVLTDHASDLLLAPTASALEQLGSEGLADRSVLVGDVMADVCFAVLEANSERPPPLPRVVSEDGVFFLSTLHRAENTDDGARLTALVEALAGMPHPVLLAVHPRLASRATEFGISLDRGSLRPIDPLPYPAMMELTRRATMVITDSGGLQKEAFLVGTPCTTTRAETEWHETLESGWNILAPDPDEIRMAALRSRPRTPRGAPFGDGHAGRRVWDALQATAERA